jgi:XTP/dITP diphosphohydrolase
LQYQCAIAFYDPQSGVEEIVEGVSLGIRASEPRGNEGFGYDPAFEPLDTPGRTMAELGGEEKDRISHRGAAVEALDIWLRGR